MSRILSIVPVWVWVVIAIALTGGAYFKGRSDADQSITIASLEEQLAFNKALNDGFMKAAEEDAKEAAAAKERLTALDDRIKDLTDYAESLEDRDRECLSGADTDRLRDLWTSPGP